MTDSELISRLQEQAIIARSAILTMTTLAGSGHPGGSMSSIDLLLTLYHFILIILKILIYQIEIE